MRHGLVAACLAAALAVPAAAGCAADSGTAARTQTQPGPTVRDLTDAEQLLVDQARELLIKECMAKAGFKYWPGPVVAGSRTARAPAMC